VTGLAGMVCTVSRMAVRVMLNDSGATQRRPLTGEFPVCAIPPAASSPWTARAAIYLPAPRCTARFFKVRAERKCGEMLAQADRNTGARGVGTSALVSSEGTPPTLAEMGLTYDQSSRYQQLAATAPPKLVRRLHHTAGKPQIFRSSAGR
jgi:hypothetical protein